jgi:IS5 family transposase
MAQQRTFASPAWTTKTKVTRREAFLAEMDAVIPWTTLLPLIAPHCPKAGRGRQPLGLEMVLRIYFVLSDPQAEDALYDSEAIRRFVGVELGDDVVPDGTTDLRFRHLLAQHQLTEALFAAIRELLEERRLLLQAGTIVDATIIHAPSSTMNATQTRDPEMQHTRKGKQWYFGMKLHVGTDLRGTVHHLAVTPAGAADITQLPALLHGQERDLSGDQAYWSEPHQQHSSARGTWLPCSQAALGLHQSPRTRLSQESGAGLHAVCAGQSPPAPASVAPAGDGPVRGLSRARVRRTPREPTPQADRRRRPGPRSVSRAATHAMTTGAGLP